MLALTTASPLMANPWLTCLAVAVSSPLVKTPLLPLGLAKAMAPLLLALS